MKTKVEYSKGFTLTYEGVQFTEDGIEYSTNPLSKIVENADNIPPKTLQFCEDFNNIGALLMRFHFGQSQRSGSLTQIVRSNNDYALDKVGKGADQTDFFDGPESKSEVVRDNLKLQQLASYPLGEAKILNRLTQAIYERNTMISGEQGLFGTMHTAVWQPVLYLASYLTKNNFLYVPCLPDITESEYQEISQALKEGNFSFDESNTKLIVKEHTFDLSSLSNIKIHPQEKEGLTFQDNGLLINLKNSGKGQAPLGWIVHIPSKKALAQEDTEDLMKLIRLAEGRFHQLSPSQQKILMSGRLESNERVRVTQNTQLNAMLSIFANLEREFDFDPRPLIDNVLKQVAKATKKSIEETNVLDDFLTGIVQTAMIQHLVVTKQDSERVVLPRAFTLNFRTIENNAKALAYAFNMKDGNGTSVLQTIKEEEPFYQDDQLSDLGINGELLMPSLTDSRHGAALLATAILVAEQMLIEQLLSNLFQEKPNEHYADALKSFLELCQGSNWEKAYADLVNLAAKCQKSGVEERLGLQYEHCAELITAMRHYIGTNNLITLASQLGTEDFSTPEKVLENISEDAKEVYAKSLKNLHLICAGLQELPGVSAAKIGSAGAVMGTSLVITKLFPKLAAILKIDDRQALSLPHHAPHEKQETQHTSTLSMCPYLKAKQRNYNAPISSNRGTFFAENQEPLAQLNKKSDAEILSMNQRPISWCNFFTAATITAVGIGGSIMAMTYLG